MSYKKNRLRLKQERISQKRSELGTYGNVIKRQLMQERGGDLEVVGGCHTYGSLGDHHIELLAGDDPTHVWVCVDGEIKRPRTMRGFKKIMDEWFWTKSGKQRK